MQPLGKQPAHHPLSSSNEDVEENGSVRAPASAINTIMGRLGLAREQNESEADEAALARDLADSSWAVRVEAVQKLGKIGKQAPLGLLLVGLNDEQGSVRAAAARALARNPRQAALPALVTALGDTEWVVRAEAAMALGKLRELAPLESLLAALKDKDATVRAATAEALGDLGSESTIEPLQEALQDEDWSVREAATRALDHVKRQAALDSPLESASAESEAHTVSRSSDTFSPPPSDSFARWLARIEAYEANALEGEASPVHSPVSSPARHARGSQSTSRSPGKQQKRKKRLAGRAWPRKLARLTEGLLASLMIACLLVAWVVIQPRPHPTQVGSSSSGNPPAFTIYHGHESSVERLAWSPDGHTIASADARGGLQIWQASTGHTLFTYQQRGEVLALTWNSADEVLAAYGEQDKTLQVLAFTIGTVERTQTLFQRTRLPGIPSVAAWSPNSQALAFDTGNGSIEIWSVRFNFNFNIATISEKRTEYAQLTWSPDSSQLATISTTGALKVWNAFTGQNLFVLASGQQATLAAWISSGQDGNHLFFINARGDIMQWWCRQSCQAPSLFLAAQAYNFANTSSSTLSAISLAPGGDQLLLATSSGAVQARDATTGNLIYVYTGHSAQVNDVEWAPDGRHIASASMDTTAQVWQEP